MCAGPGLHIEGFVSMHTSSRDHNPNMETQHRGISAGDQHGPESSAYSEHIPDITQHRLEGLSLGSISSSNLGPMEDNSEDNHDLRNVKLSEVGPSGVDGSLDHRREVDQVPGIPQPILVISLVSAALTMSSCVFNTLLPIYMVTELKMNMRSMGAFEGVMEGFSYIVRMFSGGRRKVQEPAKGPHTQAQLTIQELGSSSIMTGLLFIDDMLMAHFPHFNHQVSSVT